MSGGTDTRTQILPSVTPADSGFILPPYDFTANLPTPAQVGVRNGGSLGDVASAAQGIIYYTDVIGFGESSNPMTRGKPFTRLGINFFMKSGLQCTNGADMWTYFTGIPEGNALGSSVKKAMAEMGMPGLRGLAPGILEDAQAALNINPLLNAAFGSVYPVCERKTLPVGDEKGQLKDPNTDDVWIKGKVSYQNGRAYQTQWVQKQDKKGNPVFVDRGTFDTTAKTQSSDGSDAAPPSKEGFEDDSRKSSLVLAIIFLCGAGAIYYYKHK